ncbi:MAG: 4Fe-4S dicluster domain-containing protein [Promethearchaeota archaeon]
MSKIVSPNIIINEDECVGCRICQLWCSYIHKKVFNPSEAYIQVNNVYDLKPKISFLDGCTNCGQCVEYCLYGALTLKEVED